MDLNQLSERINTVANKLTSLKDVSNLLMNRKIDTWIIIVYNVEHFVIIIIKVIT